MAEYIEREATLLAVDKSMNGYGDVDYFGVRSKIEVLPTADVVEVRHGCWLVIENRLHLDVKCSVCKSSFYVYKQGQYRVDQSNYCPNCGAKMDGKGVKEKSILYCDIDEIIDSE